MNTRTIRIRFLFLGLLTLGLAAATAAGCGPKKDQPDPDAGVDAGTDGYVPGTLTVAVYDMTNTDQETVPLAGATVALDLPFAARVEQTTGSDGETGFDTSLADWSLGTLSVTAHKPGFGIQSRVNLTEASLEEEGGRLVMFLWALPTQAATALLMGSAVGMEDEQNNLVVLPIVKDWPAWEAQGPDFRLDVPAEQAFRALTFEVRFEGSTLGSDPWYIREFPHLKIIDVPAFDGTEIVSIDFSSGTIDGTEVEGTAALPSDPQSGLRGDTRLWIWVADRTLGKVCGWSNYSDRLDDDTFEFSTYTVDAGLPGDLYTMYQVNSATHSSIVIRDGLPEGGALADTFLEYPVWVDPPNTLGTRSLYDPIEWDPKNTDVDVSYALFVGTTPVWGVMAGMDASTLRVPEPPSSVDRDELLPGYLRGEIRVGRVQEGSIYFTKVALTPQLRLIP